MYGGIKTFGKIVEARAKEKPNNRFIRFENSDLTYDQFHRHGNKIGNFITSLGLTKGKTCAVMLPNSPEFLAAWLGLARIGVIEVPINVSFRGDLLAYILNKAECQAIFLTSELADRVRDISADLDHLQHVIIVGDNYNLVLDQFHYYSFERILTEGSEADINVDIKPSDPSLIAFSSGTTGPSKGAILCHKANFTLAEISCDVMNFGPDDRLFSVFPLYHINARYTTVLPALIADCDVVLHNRFSASKFWDICRTEGITSFTYMGSLLTILMKQPERPNDADNPVRRIQGAPAPIEIYDDFQKRFNIQITEPYGSTEMGNVTFNRAESFRKGSCGKAVPYYEVRINDENDDSCLPGEIGEIVVRPKESGVMFLGYYGMSEATVESWKNLWFHTGDRGWMDEDGYFYFVDRKKDAIRRRGENISSFEVETVVNTHPNVLDSAAVGVPSELSEEEVLIVIQLKEGQELKPEELLDFCQDRMAHFAVPRFVRFVTEFPRTPSQRIEKYKLRSEGVTEDTWDREQVGYVVKR
jgi:carnitine-CoA ligase